MVRKNVSELTAYVQDPEPPYARTPYLSEAMSITKRYFTSLLSMRS